MDLENATSPTGPYATPDPAKEIVFVNISLGFVALNSIIFVATTAFYFSRREYFPINRSRPFQVFAIAVMAWMWTMAFAVRVLLRYSTYPCSLYVLLDDPIILAIPAAYISRILTVYLCYRKSLALSVWSNTRTRTPSLQSFASINSQTDLTLMGAWPSMVATSRTEELATGNSVVRFFKLLRLPASKSSKSNSSASPSSPSSSSCDSLDEALMTTEEMKLFLAPNNQWLIKWGPNMAMFYVWLVLVLIPRVAAFGLLEFWVQPNQFSPLCDPSVDPFYEKLDIFRYLYSLSQYLLFLVGIAIVGGVYIRNFQEGLGIKQEMLMATVIALIVIGIYVALGFSRAFWIHELFVYPHTHFVFYASHLAIILALELVPAIRSFKNPWPRQKRPSDASSIGSSASEGSLGGTPDDGDTGDMELGRPFYLPKLNHAAPKKTSMDGDGRSGVHIIAHPVSPTDHHNNNNHNTQSNNNNTTPTSNLSRKQQQQQQPMKRWTLEQVLLDRQGMKAFRSFLTKEFALENLLFYLDMQELRRRVAKKKPSAFSLKILAEEAPREEVLASRLIQNSFGGVGAGAGSLLESPYSPALVEKPNTTVDAHMIALPNSMYVTERVLFRFVARIVIRYMHPDSEMALNIPGSMSAPLLSLFPLAKTLDFIATPSLSMDSLRVYGEAVNAAEGGLGGAVETPAGEIELRVAALPDFLAHVKLDDVVTQLDQVLKHVLQLMRTDAFRRFRESREFKEWVAHGEEMV